MQRLLNRLSFSGRMALGIFALSLLLTGSGGFFYYYSIYNLLIDQIGARIKDVGRTGAYLFGAPERAMIEELTRRIEAQSVAFTAADLDLGEEDTLDSLSTERAEAIMNGPEFQHLVQILRQIKDGSRSLVQPLRYIDQLPEQEEDQPLVRYTYLLVSIPDSPDYNVTSFLADADYQDLDEDGDGVISDEESGNPPGTLWLTPVDAFKQAFRGQAVAADDYYTDKWGTWLSAAVPIKSADGRVIAVLGLDYNMRNEANLLAYFLRVTFGMVAVGLLLSLVLSLLLARVLSGRLREMAGAVEKFGARDFGVRMPVSANDELGRLGRAFNSMVDDIRAYSEGLAALNVAFERFVPRQFLKQMGHDSVLTVSLGDQVESEMSVMFCDIRSFTTLSETMSPEENFNFLNEYLGRISPIIRENGGFIDKYIGDAIMALFPRKPADAISAAVQMELELALLNAERAEAGRSAIRFGIGLHYGRLMLGTVGEAERMDGTVISDAVNIAARLESLTKKYQVPLLASEDILGAAAKDTDPYDTRYLGKLRLRGRKETTRIFEILDGLPQKERKAKQNSRADIERAVELVQQRKIAEALVLLRRVREEFPEDEVATAMTRRLEKVS